MNLVGGGFTRCVKHPSQIFTGFCSFCLLERLSAIDAADRSPSCPPEPAEVLYHSHSEADLRRSSLGGGERRSLRSLFLLDDEADDSITAQSLYQESESKFIPQGTCASSSEEPGHGRECSKPRAVSFWLSSVFSKNLQKWRMNSAQRRTSSLRRCQTGTAEEEWADLEQKSRYSLDWKTFDRDKNAWEVPRHSWDGSMASRAFACSFSCAEEADDRDSDSSCAGERKRTLPDFLEAAVSSQRDSSARTTDSSSSVAEKSLRHRLAEDHHRHHQAAPGVRMKTPQKWLKIWRWSMPTPFREIPRSQAQFLKRSLSESWRESSKARAMNSLSRNNGSAAGDLHCQAKKKQQRFGRSRSSHFYSPGNLDNGLLRFYLTPLRSSRRNAKNRVKGSRPFGRGIFGFY